MLESSLIAAVCIIAYLVWNTKSVYNRLMSLDERCATAFADVDALLTHRHDLMPGLVQTLKGILGQENRMVDTIVVAMNDANNAKNAETRLYAEQNLGNTINNVFSQIDRLPQMKTASHFVDLRNSFIDVENRVTAARRYYNNTVQEHNATLRQFPGNMIGERCSLAKRDPYDLGSQRMIMNKPVQIQL